MKQAVNRSIPVIVLILIALFTLISTASADQQLRWKTERVYFKGDTLHVEGFFHNDTPYLIDHVNEFRARVKRLHHDDWQQIASATFRDIDIVIRPEGTKPFTFRIHEVEPRHIEKWKVDTWMEYHYQHKRDQRYRHHENWD
ncbi:MAG TPA: hypothetical protein VK564_10430 [Thermodesulfobacteriota bacterium]|nr:hypothetical protein [Thermodesulfobacteriota bacterium]